MSVATAGTAVSTQHHQPTAEQIRLAQLIDDKKHNQPEVQEIIRKVLDVVENSNQEDALVALFDCDYDYEKAVALLIEKGHDVASEWRTATNHKLTKKQQQKVAATKNGHDELNENGQQRGNNISTSRGKSRGGRSRFQQNGGDTQNNNNNNNNNTNQQQQLQQNDSDISQQRQRGGNGFRGRHRNNQRGGFRGTDRNYQQQQQQQQQQSQQTQDTNVDNSSPSDTNQRNKGAATNSRQQQQEQWDVGNWNGETLIISRTTKDEDQPVNSDTSSTVQNGQSNVTNQEQSKPKFDPIEAARQIKDVIGIGQTSKQSISDQQQKSKPTGQPLNTKITSPPPPPQSTGLTQQRIPHQPVIFSDHYDGGVNKIDVQFGNLGESYDDTSSATTFYQQTESIPSNKISQQRPTEQSTHISPSTRSSELPVMNQQRILLTQIQQPTMAMKPVVPPQYAVHQQPHQANVPNMLLQSLLFQQQQQQQQQQAEPVTLDTSYDPNTFSLSSLEFNSPYFMAAAMNAAQPQQQTQPRYLVSQPPSVPQQAATKNAQTSSVPTSTSSTGAKKAPAVPPGMFPPTGAPSLAQAAYSTPYGVQQQTGGPAFSGPYDTEHLFTNSFMQLTNPQQTQSPTGGYGSVTPPVQQQNQSQQANNNNDSKTMNFRGPMNENLMLIQQLSLQQTNNQQHGQQAAAHSPAMNYFLGHPPGGSNYSPGPPIMYAPAGAAAMTQQQQQFPKQQGQQYNQHNSSAGMGGNEDYYGRGSSSSNKEGQYIYAAATQPSHIPTQSTGQQQGVNKQQQQQQQQRTGGNVYNNQQGQQRPFQLK